MDCGVLGPLQVEVGGQRVALGSAQQRRLLVALLISARAVVSTDRLIATLWGDEPPATALGILRTYVSRLRSALRADGDRLLTQPPGYLLQLDPEQTDAGRFERLLVDARGAAVDRPAAALTCLDEALGLWRGPAFAEFADSDPVRPEAARLEGLRLVAVEERFDARLALGAHAELIPEIEAFAGQHSLRERPRAQLMLALYRCGRQAEALAAYQLFRTVLDEELGLEPSASLRALEGDVLRQSPELDWRPPPPEDAQTTPSDHHEGPHVRRRATDDLPAEITSLVGREADTAAVLALLASSRLVTLTGAGGVGKSRLALRVARLAAEGYPDGVHWCELAPVSQPGAVGHALATAAGARQREHNTISDALVSSFGAAWLLLVVDNCEHVLVAVRPLLLTILDGCPGVTVMATSRARLDLPGEHIWSVGPLAVPEASAVAPWSETAAAVQLFLDRARAVRPGLEADADETAEIGEVCRRLDGLPLAIELAAARMGSMNAADISKRLDDRFRLLAGGGQGETRHRALGAVVDWSYGLLSRVERRLFERLSVFAGGFTLMAIEGVCAGDGIADDEVVDVLGRLVDSSMVTVGPTGGEVRYALLETLRQYGRERLDGKSALALAAAHVRYYAAVAEAAAAQVRGRQEKDGVAVLDRELANLRAAHVFAVSSGDPDLALRLSAALFHYALWRLQGEPFRWAENALEVPRAIRHPLFGLVCGMAGWGCAVRGELSAATALAERGLTAAADDGDPARVYPLRVLGDVAIYQGRLGDCERFCRQAFELTDEPYDQALVLLGEGLALTYAGRLEAATEVRDRLDRLTAAHGNPTMTAWARYFRGELLMERDPQSAVTLFDEAIRLAASVSNRFLVGIAGISATSLHARYGEPREALLGFRDVIDTFRQGGDWTHLWTGLRSLVELFTRIGADHAAAVLHAAVIGADTAAPVYGADAERLETVAACLQRRGGPEAMTVALERARAMTDEQAVAFARAEIDRALT